METAAKLVYQTYATYLPTGFPAQYYGMPNGKIYLVFSRFYDKTFGKSGQEFVFAEHKNFKFDYENDTIIACDEEQKHNPVFVEYIDNPSSRFDILSISRKLKSYGEAQRFINRKARKMKKAV